MTSRKLVNKFLIAGSSFFQEDKLKNLLVNIDEANVRYFYGDEFDKEAFFEFALSFPLFGDLNVAVLKNAEKLKDKNVFEQLKPVEETKIILLFNTDKPKEDDYKKFKDHFTIFVEGRKKLDPQMVQDEFEKAGFTVKIDTAKYIVEMCNKNLSILHNELEKIKIYFNYEKPKSDEDIIALLSFSKSENIYDFIKAFFNRDINRAVSLMELILGDGESIERIFYELSRHVISMFLYSISPGLVNEYTYTIAYYKDYLSKWKKDQIATLISILTEIDFKIKTGATTYLSGMYRLLEFSGDIN